MPVRSSDQSGEPVTGTINSIEAILTAASLSIKYLNQAFRPLHFGMTTVARSLIASQAFRIDCPILNTRLTNATRIGRVSHNPPTAIIATLKML